MRSSIWRVRCGVMPRIRSTAVVHLVFLGRDEHFEARFHARLHGFRLLDLLSQKGLRGSLQAGKFADLIVLDRNPLKIPAEEMANVRVLETVVGGKTVYEAGQAR